MSKKLDMKKAPSIAILGTGSEVGKSIVTTALCRIFVNRWLRVAPFKAQNISNNSGVTPEGLEMGRAQIVQAEAAKISPHVDMNPILLKPTRDIGSQVVLHGKVMTEKWASEHNDKKNMLFAKACNSLDRLRKIYDVIVMEGAGSCAEVNLMEKDIANFPMAEYAQAPVVLVSDIDRGGVFAQIIGTLACLSSKRQHMIKGFIINRFQGDINLFKDGVSWLEEKTGKKVFGVIPWYGHFHIEAEDSVVIERPVSASMLKENTAVIAVIRLPHISNFTDFDPLSNLKGLEVNFIEKVRKLNDFKAVILPGSKNTRWDLRWLKKTGWADTIKKYADMDGHVLGICGGYQMMGRFVHDPHGLEGTSGTSKGLDLLPIETILKAPKTTTRTRFSWKNVEGLGYEIHMGETKRLGGNALFNIIERNRLLCQTEDGCEMNNSKFMGTYIHGMFDTPAITQKWIETIGLEHIKVPHINHLENKDKTYDLLAEHFEHHMNIEAIFDLI